MRARSCASLVTAVWDVKGRTAPALQLLQPDRHACAGLARSTAPRSCAGQCCVRARAALPPPDRAPRARSTARPRSWPRTATLWWASTRRCCRPARGRSWPRCSRPRRRPTTARRCAALPGAMAASVSLAAPGCGSVIHVPALGMTTCVRRTRVRGRAACAQVTTGGIGRCSAAAALPA